MDYICKYAFMLLENHANLKSGACYYVYLYDDRLTIEETLFDNKATLYYSQVTNVVYNCEVETKTVKKSPIGRAIVGGILTGGVGAVVGAVSGIGTKEKVKKRYYFTICYTSSMGTSESIKFEDKYSNDYNKAVKNFIDKLKELCNIVDPIDTSETEITSNNVQL